MKIGLFGGSFNPVHLGHLIIARDVLEVHGLDRMLWIPCRVPPHKATADLATPEHRAAMVELAIAGEPRFELCRLELERDGPSYTVDTVRTLRGRLPRDELFFLVGADTVPEMASWRDIGELMRLCEFIAVARPGGPCRPAPASLGLPREPAERMLARWTEAHWIGISSSEIRRRLAAGLSVRYLVPDPVERYLRDHRLYGA
ncbi:MAG: nicotinate-nucleotide adenylyltransferase [Kiritimatiellae bacterium]|nr:nicotinate-nucleotide adenylyltransferase [Kiritimatiellia bacterium]